MSSDSIVYLLDDEPEMLKALSRVLNAHGFQTKAFLSAREFLAHDQTSQPACLVLDLAMPELDGRKCSGDSRETVCGYRSYS